MSSTAFENQRNARNSHGILFKTHKRQCHRNNILYITKHKDGKQYDEPRFLPFVRVQCSIALAAVNRLGEKLSPKNEIVIEKVK